MEEYLKEQGVRFNANGFCTCISPTHADRTPSMRFVERQGIPHKTKLKCFGCGITYDIFDVANIFEERPTEGKSWLLENVYYLADKYGVPHDRVELTEEELLVLKQEKLFAAAAEILVDWCEQHPEWYKPAQERRITPETCKAFGIGTVPWPTFSAELTKRGFSLDFVKESGITKEYFDRDRLTFTLRDHRGRVVGFDRRYIPWNKKEAKAHSDADQYYPTKYHATDQSKCRLIQKETMLYGLHWAKKKPAQRLDVFEGYIDWITAYQAGHSCCVALCMSSLTDAQIEILRGCGFRHVNLVLDMDEVGIVKMLGDPSDEKKPGYLQKFKGIKGMRITVMPLPFNEKVPLHHRDPDFYIRSVGLENYMRAKPITAFEWMLSERLKAGMDTRIVARDMVGFILNEESPIERGVMARQLAEKTGIAESDIRRELDQEQDTKVLTLTDDLIKNLGRIRSAKDKRALILVANERLRTIGDGNSDAYNLDEISGFMKDAVNLWKARDAGLLGWKTGWPVFDTAINGIPKAKEILAFGGNPNTGKSSILVNIATRVLQFNEEPTVVFLSLDDPRIVTFAKMIGADTGIPLRDIFQPRRELIHDGVTLAAYKESVDKFKTLAHECRLILKGTEMGHKTEDFERLIKHTQDRTGRPVLLLGDSFHNIAGDQGEERIKYKRAADWIQHTTDVLNYTAIWTVEVTKMGLYSGRPSLADLAETAKITFGFKFIGMLYNDVHQALQRNNAQPKNYWVDPTAPADKKSPILEISVQKNKISEFKGDLCWKLQDHVARMEETTRKQFKKEIADREALSGSTGSAEGMGHDIFGAVPVREGRS
jgi:DNA primase